MKCHVPTIDFQALCFSGAMIVSGRVDIQNCSFSAGCHFEISFPRKMDSWPVRYIGWKEVVFVKPHFFRGLTCWCLFSRGYADTRYTLPGSHSRFRNANLLRLSITTLPVHPFSWPGHQCCGHSPAQDFSPLALMKRRSDLKWEGTFDDSFDNNETMYR